MWLRRVASRDDSSTSAVTRSRTRNLPLVTRTPDVAIYRNDHVLPRAWIAPSGSDLNAVAEIVPGSLVKSLTDSGNAVTIHASSPHAGWLILADTFYPGWQATIDGAPVEIQIANGAFRAVSFPAGDHTIEFRYEPLSVRLGLIISLASLTIIVMGLLGLHLRDRRR